MAATWRRGTQPPPPRNPPCALLRSLRVWPRATFNPRRPSHLPMGPHQWRPRWRRRLGVLSTRCYYRTWSCQRLRSCPLWAWRVGYLGSWKLLPLLGRLRTMGQNPFPGLNRPLPIVGCVMMGALRPRSTTRLLLLGHFFLLMLTRLGWPPLRRWPPAVATRRRRPPLHRRPSVKTPRRRPPPRCWLPSAATLWRRPPRRRPPATARGRRPPLLAIRRGCPPLHCRLHAAATGISLRSPLPWSRFATGVLQA